MDTLTKLFGSTALVKLLRLFLNNPEAVFETKDIIVRCRITPVSLRRELVLLKNIDFVEQKNFTVSSKRDKKTTRRKASGYLLNKNFSLNNALRAVLFNADPYRNDEILARFKNIGRLKCLFVAGVFIQNNDSRLDLLVVGDNLKRGAIEQIIRGMEAEVGKELSYSVFDTKEFQYRLNIQDKFIRDVLDYPHEKILDKIGL